MIRTYLIPLLAIAGVLTAAYNVVRASRPEEPALPVVQPPEAPFTAFVAGSGIIESSTQNIAIGTHVGGVVQSVPVVVGATVRAGDTLFTLDIRDLNAQLAVREAALEVARQQVARLRAQPRPEEIPPAEANVAEALASLGDAEAQLARWEQIPDPRAVNPDELTRRRYAVETAKARLAAARAELDLLKAGAFSYDIKVAEAGVLSAEADVAAVRTDIDRRIIRAPVDATVLQVNVRPGEFAQAGTLLQPLMLIGATDVLHVRVDVDENDAWRVRAGSNARAFLRGNKDIQTALRFVRYEPYIVPKRSLTGESTERVDTRVLQIIFSFDRETLPVYVGQQMDVYIESEPIDRRPAQPPAAG